MEFRRTRSDRVRGLLMAATFPRAESEDGKAARDRTAEHLLTKGMDGYADEMPPKMLAPAIAGV